MTRSRLGLMGLCVALFGVMAFGTASAQATVGAHWWILNSAGTVKTDAASLTAKLNLKVDTLPVLHTKIAGATVLLECTGISLNKANLLANGSIGESAGNVKGVDFKFTGCITKINGATSAPCQPKSEGVAGVILSKRFHGLIILHTEGVELIQIIPDEGETLATMESSAECAIGAKVPIIGKLTFRDCLGQFKTHVVEHLWEAGQLTELWAISKTEEHKMTILGSFWAFLEGVHAGLKWAGEAA